MLDAVREVKPPFSPESVAREFASFFLSYRVSKVRGDRYAGEWPREQFRKYGVDYEPAAKPKSELYGELLPLINSRRVALLDNARLVSQLIALERRVSRGGRDSIDHPPGAHDDLANSVAGVVSMLAEGEGQFTGFLTFMKWQAEGYPEDLIRPAERIIAAELAGRVEGATLARGLGTDGKAILRRRRRRDPRRSGGRASAAPRRLPRP